MSPKLAKLAKLRDESSPIRCAAGMGELREETWVNGTGRVVRYNLAFICFGLYAGDNGRVLGYDTAHGRLHRHFAGEIKDVEAASYEEILERFLAEVSELKQRRNLWS